METLTSLKNPKVMLWRSLKEHKGREETGLFLVEGVRMVQEALSSPFPVQALLLRDDFEAAFSIPPDLPRYILSAGVFDAVCDTKTPQGIAAVLRNLPRSESAALVRSSAGPRLLALDHVQDPGNVGTLIRTADAAGFDGLLLSPDCADVFAPRVLRATMGSIFRMDIRFPPSLPEALAQLRSSGYALISSQLDGEPFYARSPVPVPFVLIVGNEGNGISPEVKALATCRFRLPMRGGAESLNAAVAGAVMMYDLTRDL